MSINNENGNYYSNVACLNCIHVVDSFAYMGRHYSSTWNTWYADYLIKGHINEAILVNNHDENEQITVSNIKYRAKVSYKQAW